MPTSVDRINVAAAMPILDEDGAIVIFQAAQLELADTLTNGLSMRIAQMAELAARLRSAPTLAARLQALKPPSDSGATIGVLGENLDQANALWSELDGLGVSVNAPVGVPVLQYDSKKNELALVWMTPEQRSALSDLPKLNVTLDWDGVVRLNPDAEVLRSWGDGTPPDTTDQRGDLGGISYFCYDDKVNRHVKVGDFDRLINLLPEAIERGTAQLETAKFNAQDDIAALGDVITDANQTAVKRHSDAHARTLDTRKDARRAEDRALQRRRDDANPVVKPPSPDIPARAQRTEPQPTPRGRRNG